METGSERVRFDHKVLRREQAGGGCGVTQNSCVLTGGGYTTPRASQHSRKYRSKRVNAADLSKF